MQHERLAFRRTDDLGEAVEVLRQVDVRLGRVPVYEERVVEAKIDAGRLDAGIVEGFDTDAARVDLIADRAIGEDHSGASVFVQRDTPDVIERARDVILATTRRL